jgi:para-aminobenzoate synthetase component 1
MKRSQELPYSADSSKVFQGLLGLPYCVFLDSGHDSRFAARYDILTARPYVTLTTSGIETEIWSRDGVEVSVRDPLDLLRETIGACDSDSGDLPFAGGAIGHFSYDLARRFERFAGRAVRDIEFPEMVFGIYDWALVVDHQRKRSFLVSEGRDPETAERWDEIVGLFATHSVSHRREFQVVSRVLSNFDRAEYTCAFDRIQDHIRRGDCYQVNFSQRFEARVSGDSWNAYVLLRNNNPAPFSAYFRTPNGDILSSSPERFLTVSGDYVESKPIKGTRPRSKDPDIDARLRDELVTSPKDRAENIMIVDLLRNDLGKSCVPGSIEVSKVFDVESYAHVHHLVSTVNGRLSPGKHPLDLVKGCFPGGSITGAPKVRAMQIIDDIEPQRRSIYCGSIGYLGFNGRMDLNIAIRTLLRTGDTMYAWAGGGIVADSDADLEFQECLDKASGLLAVLGSSSFSAAG